MIKRKILMVAHVASMIDLFNMRNIELLQNMGFEVEVACNFEEGNVTSKERIEKFKQILEEKNIAFYQIPFPRNIRPVGSLIKVYRQFHSFVSTNKYEMIYCQGPISGVLTRFAARKLRKNGTKIIYAAHGFHFFKGAPIKNWLLFYPIELFCAKLSDYIITINQEDYRQAMTFKPRAKNNVVFVPGVGIEVSKIQNIKIDRNKLLEELGIPPENKIVLTVGELVSGKNHVIALKAFAKANLENVTYLICGIGLLREKLENISKKMNLEGEVKFLGYREDIFEIVNIADVFLFPSLREGLPVAVMEALAAGVPVICSNVRGNRDLVQNGKGGYVVEKNDVNAFADKIKLLVEDNELNLEMRKFNKQYIKAYDVKIVDQQMKKLFLDI